MLNSSFFLPITILSIPGNGHSMVRIAVVNSKMIRKSLGRFRAENGRTENGAL
jgi:hypothetical protein